MSTSDIYFKKSLIFILTIICGLTVKVDAASCSSTERNNLRKEASNIEIIQNLDEDYNPLHKYFYNINIVNFSDKFYILDSLGNRFEYDSSYNENTIFGMYYPNSKVTFKIYGAYDKPCEDEQLTVVSVTFPPYNDYSTFDECRGVEEFYLCKRNYSGKIESDEWFLDQVEKYKNGEIENIDIDGEEENKSFFKLISEFVKKNPIAVVSIILVIVAIIIAFISIIMISNTKRIRINLKKGKNGGKDDE